MNDSPVTSSLEAELKNCWDSEASLGSIARPRLQKNKQQNNTTPWGLGKKVSWCRACLVEPQDGMNRTG